MQHDLHHRELVQVGVEQRRDDHRWADRPALPAFAGYRNRSIILPVHASARPADRFKRDIRVRGVVAPGHVFAGPARLASL